MVGAILLKSQHSNNVMPMVLCGKEETKMFLHCCKKCHNVIAGNHDLVSFSDWLWMNGEERCLNYCFIKNIS